MCEPKMTTKLHKADSSTAHVLRILIIMAGAIEAGAVITMVILMSACVGWDKDPDFSAIMALLIAYPFTVLFIIAVALLPFARSWQRGVLLGLMMAEVFAFLCSIAASVWRGIWYGECDDAACHSEKDCVLALLVLNSILAAVSVINLAMVILLRYNVKGNPIRAQALKVKKNLHERQRVVVKDEEEPIASVHAGPVHAKISAEDDYDSEDEEEEPPHPRRKPQHKAKPQRKEQEEADEEGGGDDFFDSTTSNVHHARPHARKTHYSGNTEFEV